MLPEGPAVWAEAPPISETTPQRQELTTQLISQIQHAHAPSHTYTDKHTLNFSHAGALS